MTKLQLQSLPYGNLPLLDGFTIYRTSSVENTIGHAISEDGIKPDPDKIQAVRDYPTPKNKDNIKSFLADTSQHAVGAVLSQGIIGKDLPIGYASRTLSKAEKNYSTIERELAAIIYGVQYFRPYLHIRKKIFEGNKKNHRERKSRDSVGDRRAGGCAASRGMRITCVACGIRAHPRERIADAMVHIVRRCQASRPSKSPKILPYRLPFCRLTDIERPLVIYLPYRTVKEYQKVLLQFTVEQPLSAERNSSIQFTVPYREGVPESPPSNYRGAPPFSGKELFVEFSTVVRLWSVL
ncbi:hypothetical protein GEV33_004245 [Tenebrio molitor]|uniref:Reverse transcriptase/retrotransposon-derived protein RNase H-like domain-containing protein n=1 Tax=Tenebrio molitor TaxID=7067 RepID=A0A8J6HGU7_TENMO|nr:hypothetical protein GEV33_004245 [Tenebrio molitor]